MIAWALLGLALAQGMPPAPQADHERYSLRELRVFQLAAGGHPNERWRWKALEALKLERLQGAVRYFRHAARYADKYSQHRLSLMHWHGQGTGADRALGYVWADLAAERGYPDLLRIREKMWLELTARERERVLDIGPGYYDEFGDEAAKPRLAERLERTRRFATGTRTGAGTGGIDVQWRWAAGTLAAQGEQFLVPGDFWAPHRWDPDRYWQVEDTAWGMSGQVEVGPLDPQDERD